MKWWWRLVDKFSLVSFSEKFLDISSARVVSLRYERRYGKPAYCAYLLLSIFMRIFRKPCVYICSGSVQQREKICNG